MNELVNELSNKENFNWNIGRVKSGPGVIMFLIGTKK